MHVPSFAELVLSSSDSSFFYPEKTENKMMMRTTSKRISMTEGLASLIDFLFIRSILKMNKNPGYFKEGTGNKALQRRVTL